MEEAILAPNVRFYFEHKVQAVDFDARTMNVRDVVGEKDLTVAFDFCVGADGSHSVIRRQMMRVTRFVSPGSQAPHRLTAVSGWITNRSIFHMSTWN